MNRIVKKSNKKAAFTIIELLTVMSIIVVLIGLLIPSLNMVRRYAKSVRQKAQLGSIGTAIELFSAEHDEHDGYPSSSAKDEIGDQYCGAMKLAEAMVGLDFLGFHPDSRFRSDGRDPALLPPYDDLYPPPDTPDAITYAENLQRRKGPYLQPEYANANKLKHLYGVDDILLFTGEEVVLCDVYSNVVLKPAPGDPPGLDIGRKSGMPILYYRADTSKTLHKPDAIPKSDNIYNSEDNLMLLALGVPGKPPPDPTGVHPLFDVPAKFYDITRNEKIITLYPCRADSYILISAGFDGLYGTEDDVFNFKK